MPDETAFLLSGRRSPRRQSSSKTTSWDRQERLSSFDNGTKVSRRTTRRRRQNEISSLPVAQNILLPRISYDEHRYSRSLGQRSSAVQRRRLQKRTWRADRRARRSVFSSCANERTIALSVNKDATRFSLLTNSQQNPRSRLSFSIRCVETCDPWSRPSSSSSLHPHPWKTPLLPPHLSRPDHISHVMLLLYFAGRPRSSQDYIVVGNLACRCSGSSSMSSSKYTFEIHTRIQNPLLRKKYSNSL